MMARAPARPARAGNFRVEIDGAAARTVDRLGLPRLLAEPDPALPPLLALRRAVTADGLFHDWWEAARAGEPATRLVTVTMLAPDATPILVWRFVGARPWALIHGPLDAGADDVLTETLELSFECFERSAA